MVDFYQLGERVLHELALASGEPKGLWTLWGCLKLVYVVDDHQLPKEPAGQTLLIKGRY